MWRNACMFHFFLMQPVYVPVWVLMRPMAASRSWRFNVNGTGCWRFLRLSGYWLGLRRRHAVDSSESIGGVSEVALLALELGEWTVVHRHVGSDPLVLRYWLVVFRVQHRAGAGQCDRSFGMMLMLLLSNGLLLMVCRRLLASSLTLCCLPPPTHRPFHAANIKRSNTC